MKQFILLACYLITFPTLAQQFEFKEPMKVIASEKVGSIKQGATLYLSGLTYRNDDGGAALVTIIAKDGTGTRFDFNSNKIRSFEFKDVSGINMVWDRYLLVNQAYKSILKNGYQYSLRQELNDDALEFTKSIRERFFNDDFLEDYLYTLLTKIHPGILYDERPGNIYIKVIKDSQPDAFVLPNGCIVISTGMLSTLQSEDELVGVLAHEVAHFVLDHFVMNYNTALDRKKSAEFWAGFATVIAAGADAYLTSQNENHVPGLLTVSTAVVATAFANDVIERLGIKYNKEQEIEADNASKHILKVLNYDTLGLSVALQRIKEYCVVTGNYLALTGSGTHPSIGSRIKNLGSPDNLMKFTQPSYLKRVSGVNSYSARTELWSFAHHESALMLAERNISNGVAVESDYIVKAVIKRRLSNTKESNQEVLALLQKARDLNVTPMPIISKEEGITWIRLGNKPEAKKAFQAYLDSLLEIEDRIEKLEYPNNNTKGLSEEIIWTMEMIFKADSL
ncbi:MAG: M48 family metalloprotease [Cyclobacteriaceae bacterium]|nr:M48 family metalloprotease [Cyclobacteriaceae bacterium]